MTTIIATDDMLEEIFNLQIELQARYGHDFKNMTIDERVELIKTWFVALSSEMTEMMCEVGWKYWSTAPRYIDRDRFAGEWVDAFKFLLNMALVVEMEPQEMLQRFRGKTTVNHSRQDNAYDHRDKCSCGRALDEPKAL